MSDKPKILVRLEQNNKTYYIDTLNAVDDIYEATTLKGDNYLEIGNNKTTKSNLNYTAIIDLLGQIIDASNIKVKCIIGGTKFSDSIIGSVNNDTIISYGGEDTIFSDGGSDKITISGNNSFVDSGAGNDHIYLYGNDSTIVSGNGNDYIFISSSDVKKITIGDLIASDYIKFFSQSALDSLTAFIENDQVIIRSEIDDTNIILSNISKISEIPNNFFVNDNNNTKLHNLLKIANINLNDFKINGYLIMDKESSIKGAADISIEDSSKLGEISAVNKTYIADENSLYQNITVPSGWIVSGTNNYNDFNIVDDAEVTLQNVNESDNINFNNGLSLTYASTNKISVDLKRSDGNIFLNDFNGEFKISKLPDFIVTLSGGKSKYIIEDRTIEIDGNVDFAIDQTGSIAITDFDNDDTIKIATDDSTTIFIAVDNEINRQIFSDGDIEIQAKNFDQTTNILTDDYQNPNWYRQAIDGVIILNENYDLNKITFGTSEKCKSSGFIADLNSDGENYKLNKNNSDSISVDVINFNSSVIIDDFDIAAIKLSETDEIISESESITISAFNEETRKISGASKITLKSGEILISNATINALNDVIFAESEIRISIDEDKIILNVLDNGDNFKVNDINYSVIASGILSNDKYLADDLSDGVIVSDLLNGEWINFKNIDEVVTIDSTFDSDCVFFKDDQIVATLNVGDIYSINGNVDVSIDSAFNGTIKVGENNFSGAMLISNNGQIINNVNDNFKVNDQSYSIVASGILSDDKYLADDLSDGVIVRDLIKGEWINFKNIDDFVTIDSTFDSDCVFFKDDQL
ncbi:MAG: hypothetical protein IJ728_01935, partial [Selenomonadaceae bacterium]|nr:hypothetical protein [Selenomonadaceae bacterium]